MLANGDRRRCTLPEGLFAYLAGKPPTDLTKLLSPGRN